MSRRLTPLARLPALCSAPPRLSMQRLTTAPIGAHSCAHPAPVQDDQSQRGAPEAWGRQAGMREDRTSPAPAPRDTGPRWQDRGLTDQSTLTIGHLCLVPLFTSVHCSPFDPDFPLGPGFSPQLEWGPRGGGWI